MPQGAENKRNSSLGGLIGSALGSALSQGKARASGELASGRPQSIARGVHAAGKGFFARVWRAVHALFLQVTGLFFLLIACAAMPSVYKAWATHKLGDSFTRPVVTSLFCLMFFYFALSSFWRAARKS